MKLNLSPLIVTLAITFASFASAQTKPTVINLHESGDNLRVNKQYRNHNINPNPLGGSCWQELDAEFLNVNNQLYGNEGYSSSYPLDDGSYGPIELGWTFTFYGETYSALYINVNGNVTFGDLHSAYSARGFPSSSVPAMIAPFWGDVDLRGSGNGANKIYVKQESGKISIQWVGVGYYNQKTNLTNTFQLILTDGNDNGVGVGNNAMFAYDDMNWCVGDASGGSNGFGSNVYATVGAQSAGGAEFYQIGLFGKDNIDYDGAGGNLDGVHYLDGRCFSMNLSQSNVPPIANNLPNNRTIDLCPGMTYSLESSFSSPEIGQVTNTTITNTTLFDFQSSTTTGNLSSLSITINPSLEDTGLHYIAYQAQDNGTPAAVTYDTLWVNVYNCGSPGSSSSIEFDGVDDYSVVHHHPALYSGGTNTYSVWVYPAIQTSDGPINIMKKDGQFKLEMIGNTNTPVATISVNSVEYTVFSNENLITNKWSHICAVVESDNLKIYIDGELKGSTSIPGIIDVTNQPLYVGGTENQDGFFKGRLDELSLISKACNIHEVDQLRWELSSIDPLYLRAYFKCTSDMVLTNSTNPYHGTLINMSNQNKWKNNYGKIWNGSASSSYDTPQNWDEGLPPVLSSEGGIEADQFVVFDKVTPNSFHLKLNDVLELNNAIFTINSDVVIEEGGQLKLKKDLFSYVSPTYYGEVLFSGTDEQNIFGSNTFKDLKIDNNVQLTTDQIIEGNLTLNTGTLVTNDFDLLIVSNENGSGQIFHNSGSIIGEVTMERRLSYNANSIGWHYLSFPMENLTVNDLNQDMQIIGLGTNADSDPFPSFYYYNETNESKDFIKGWETPNNSGSNLNLMTGYIYYKYTKEEQKLKLKGNLFTGNKSKFLTYTSSGDQSADGWNLVGNPYPSAINWDAVTIPNNMDNAMYLYDNISDKYKVYIDGIGINGATNRIPTMTSYFVHVNEPLSFLIDNTVRVADSETKHYRTASANEFMITMELSSGDNTDQTIIRLRDGATSGFDSNYDAYKIMSSKGVNIYSKSGNDNLSINSIDQFEDQIVIPVVLEAKSQVFTLNVITKGTWFNEYDVLLLSEDNKEYSLDEDMTFNINSEENSSKDYHLIIRKVKDFATGDRLVHQDDLKIKSINGELLIEEAIKYHSYEGYSLEGKLLFSGRINNQGFASFSLNRVSSSVILVRVIGHGDVRVDKINSN